MSKQEKPEIEKQAEKKLLKKLIKYEKDRIKNQVKKLGYNPLEYQKCEKCNRVVSIKCIETHHKKQKSNGGSNKKENLIEICSNCHRKIHN